LIGEEVCLSVVSVGSTPQDSATDQGITQVFAAATAREALDLIEKEPQRTLKVQLDFS
jgi:hypothetical protein